jgi:hypothetical protein
MFRVIIAAGLLCLCADARASADGFATGKDAVQPASNAIADASSAKKKRRAPRNPAIVDHERLRIPNNRVIPPSAGGSGTTYSDRVVGCTHGAGVAGISGLDRGPAIHNCAFGN